MTYSHNGCKFFKKILKKLKKSIDILRTVRYNYNCQEVMNMFLVKKVLIYLVHRQALKQRQVREQHNREQIKLILQDFE